MIVTSTKKKPKSGFILSEIEWIKPLTFFLYFKLSVEFAHFERIQQKLPLFLSALEEESHKYSLRLLFSYLKFVSTYLNINQEK